MIQYYLYLYLHTTVLAIAFRLPYINMFVYIEKTRKRVNSL